MCIRDSPYTVHVKGAVHVGRPFQNMLFQIYVGIGGEIVNAREILIYRPSLLATISSVSYTHLDVYKRQVCMYGHEYRPTI